MVHKIEPRISTKDARDALDQTSAMTNGPSGKTISSVRRRYRMVISTKLDSPSLNRRAYHVILAKQKNIKLARFVFPFDAVPPSGHPSQQCGTQNIFG